jgi:ABC-type transport system substrate-binding protein
MQFSKRTHLLAILLMCASCTANYHAMQMSKIHVGSTAIDVWNIMGAADYSLDSGAATTCDYQLDGYRMVRYTLVSGVVQDIEVLDDAEARIAHERRVKNAGTVAVAALAIGAAVVVGKAIADSDGGGGGYYVPADVVPTRELLVFGGANSHDVFLGCLTCSQYSTESIRNTMSIYGNGSSYIAITNRFSLYGSRYSTTSACNPNASNPPAIVDRQGNFYGYLTMNPTKNPTNDTWIRGWLAGVCSSH